MAWSCTSQHDPLPNDAQSFGVLHPHRVPDGTLTHVSPNALPLVLQGLVRSHPHRPFAQMGAAVSVAQLTEATSAVHPFVCVTQPRTWFPMQDDWLHWSM